MKRFRIWQDLKTGRNLDIYLTVLLAIAIAVLNTLGITTFNVVSTAILTTLALVSYSLLQDRRKNQPSIFFSADNDSNNDYICKYISTNKITSAQIIQYSGDMLRRVIQQLLAKGVKVQLLLQHPSNAMNPFQLKKMDLFHKLAEYEFKNSHNLSIRYYKEPASIRGVKLDDKFLSMGWYTYRNKGTGDKTPWLYGHNNAAVIVDLTHAAAHDLVTTFNEAFNALWETAIPEKDAQQEINQAMDKLKSN